MNGRWERGRSSNPGGRPKGQSEKRRLALAHAEEAVSTLIVLMRSDRNPPGVRRKAASDLLRIALGRSVALPEIAGLLAQFGWEPAPASPAAAPPVSPDNTRVGPRPPIGVPAEKPDMRERFAAGGLFVR